MVGVDLASKILRPPTSNALRLPPPPPDCTSSSYSEDEFSNDSNNVPSAHSKSHAKSSMTSLQEALRRGQRRHGNKDHQNRDNYTSSSLLGYSDNHQRHQIDPIEHGSYFQDKNDRNNGKVRKQRHLHQEERQQYQQHQDYDGGQCQSDYGEGNSYEEDSHREESNGSHLIPAEEIEMTRTVPSQHSQKKPSRRQKEQCQNQTSRGKRRERRKERNLSEDSDSHSDGYLGEFLSLSPDEGTESFVDRKLQDSISNGRRKYEENCVIIDERNRLAKGRKHYDENKVNTHPTHVEEEDYDYDDDDDDKYDFGDDDDDDDDEERPLRKHSKNSPGTHLHSHRPHRPILSRTEQCLNRTLVVALGVVFLIFLHDHFPWGTKRRVASQRHYNEFEMEADNRDPMTVYNTNDDDSTHLKDHDPLNKYAELTAGKRISDRPAHKSLNHGFMDKTYENRPAAQNSGSTALDGGSNNQIPKELDEETAAFLKSVMRTPGKSSGGGSSTHANEGENEEYDPVYSPLEDKFSSKPKSISSPSSSSLSENQEQQYESESENIHSGVVSNDVNSTKSLDGDIVSQLSDNGDNIINDAQDKSLETDIGANMASDMKSDDRSISMSEHGEQSVSSGDVTIPSDGMSVDNNKSTSAIESGATSHQTTPPESDSFSSIVDQPMANEAMSGEAFLSDALRTQSADQVKEVYKDSFYRWNHPFRPYATNGEGMGNDGGIDVPVFWRIPRSASGTIEQVMSYCYGLTLASALGTTNGHNNDEKLGIMTVEAGGHYVNVDMSNPIGIQRAKAMNLGASDLADVVSTPYIYETADIFEGIPECGKCFTLLRHPVERSISLYHHYQKDNSENQNTAQYKGMTIDEYAEQVQENNWMVRFLTNKRSGPLSWHDLEAAKEVFGRKCLVGLIEKTEESIKRYERFFGWEERVSNSEMKDECLEKFLTNGDKRNEHQVYEGTNAWEELRKKNEYDVLLYEYAKSLYTQQSVIYEKSFAKR